ncbi:MAG: ferrous iron transport protein B [Tenericutes bacterium HGW-Tenericutes-1]|jgi:ferrous iron transport protein B|nr:MAG: ferrous iron transport protein B [Tenericutes bacterium HGW-Tenericutes-1]
MTHRIALVGNPNSGKTTLFNGLTGSNQSVGNWPGVTIEKKVGKLKNQNFEADIVDLPGVYSLSSLSLEEEVTTKYVLSKSMDLIINIVDASNMERNLFLTHQLLDSTIPMVIALNCMDIAKTKFQGINIPKLEALLGVPIVPITASKKHGLMDLIRVLEVTSYEPRIPQKRYSDQIETTISEFQSILEDRLVATRFFEDGFKADKLSLIDDSTKIKLQESLEHAKKQYLLDFDMVLPNERYNLILTICDQVLTRNEVEIESTTDKIDKILTHRILGLPLFLGIMFLVFYLSFGPIGTFITDGFVWLIESFFSFVASGIESAGMAAWVSSLVVNGIFGGLAAVLGFLPQLTILFLFLSILEDSGYMARAAFIMDRVLRRFGLSGKSFIPMLIGFGCSVPAMAATRTLDKSEDRKITTMIIPFISCGAKAPIYGIIAGAIFASHSYLVVFSMYIIGIVVAILSAILFKKTILKGASANYLMELPEYRMPTAKNTFLHTWERVKGFLIKAGTILLGAFIVIWFLSYFGFVDGTFRLLSYEELEFSLLGMLGKALLPIFSPIGFTDWQATVAILTGFVAKESVVGTLGILYGVAGDVLESGALLYPALQAAFTPLQAYAFMIFALLTSPCIAAIAAMKKELGSWKWLIFALFYEITVAYIVALLVYQLGLLGIGALLTAIVFIVVIFIVYSTIRRIIKSKGSTCSSCSGCGIEGSCDKIDKNK